MKYIQVYGRLSILVGMVLEMLRRMEPEEEEGLYVGLPRPEIAPRPNLNVSASGSTSLGRPRRKLSSDREDIYEVLSPSEFPVVSPEAPSVPPHHPLLSPNKSWTHPSPLQHKSVLQPSNSSVSLV